MLTRSSHKEILVYISYAIEDLTSGIISLDYRYYQELLRSQTAFTAPKFGSQQNAYARNVGKIY